MTDEPLDLTDIEARDAGWVLPHVADTHDAIADRRALLAEVKRLRAQLNYWQARAESAEDKLDGQAWLDLTRDRDELRDRTEQIIAIVADDHPGMYRPQEILAQIRRVLDPTQPEETP